LPRRLAVNAGIGAGAMNAGAPAANNKADEKSAASKRRELEQWQQNTGLSMMEVKLIASRFKVRLFGRAAPSVVREVPSRDAWLQTLSRGGLLTNESFQRVIQARLGSLREGVRARFCLTYLPAPAALGRCS
jgi:predicted acylesterase/phospholipase RssA